MSVNHPFSASGVRHRLSRLWNKRSVTITEYDPAYKVSYLGNVITQWAKGEGCVDKPLATLWKNYCANVKHEIGMKVTVGNSGLKAVTKEHGLTEYWANRITFCAAPAQYPRVFCWVYRHEGRRMKQELRCHAVLCDRAERAQAMATQLHERLALALQEFRREKLSKQKARLSLANACYDNPTLPRRKLLLSTGSANFRPPVEQPKLTAIDETAEEEEEEEDDEDYFLDDFLLGGSVVSEVESSSDIVPDDVDSLSDLTDGPQTDSDSVDDLPDPRRRRRSSSLKLIDERGGEEDAVSDESGYSEEKDSFKDDTYPATHRM